ncbi:hypothetical protein FSP39_002663 [Pinctada imbricata]|uniref:Uncharacterized protein n=1 Tax=Pinctada imbricata TaxID=66713 RepID=A0AA88YLF5_PINIB|nr:hypothetical protein FSP39_002663 [Pinctada imbricata]
MSFRESHCFCVEPEGIDSNYESRPIADCNYTCNMKPDEYCGSNRNSTIYNIYSVVEPYEESNIFTDIYTSGEGLCLLYKLRQGEINASVCDDDSANRIACRDESLKRCQAIFVENGEICFNESKCDALEGVHYACKTGERYLASDFNFTYRYIDDMLSINNPNFADYLSSIYPSELEV